MHLFIQTVHLLCCESLASKTDKHRHRLSEMEGKEREREREMKPHCQGTYHKGVFRANMTMARMCFKAYYFKWLVRHKGSFPQCQVKSKKGKMLPYAAMDQSRMETKRHLHREAEKSKSEIDHTANHPIGNGLVQRPAVYFQLK